MSLFVLLNINTIEEQLDCYIKYHKQTAVTCLHRNLAVFFFIDEAKSSLPTISEQIYLTVLL